MCLLGLRRGVLLRIPDVLYVYSHGYIYMPGVADGIGHCQPLNPSCRPKSNMRRLIK